MTDMEEVKVTKKICLDCRGDLPLEEFHNSLTGMFGVVSSCKFCVSFKNYNRSRKKKGLPLFSTDEYRSYYFRKYRKEKSALEVKIERLFHERRIRALQAYRELERTITKELTETRKEMNRLKEVIRIIKQD